jgi:hypothetical protein
LAFGCNLAFGNIAVGCCINSLVKYNDLVSPIRFVGLVGLSCLVGHNDLIDCIGIDLFGHNGLNDFIGLGVSFIGLGFVGFIGFCLVSIAGLIGHSLMGSSASASLAYSAVLSAYQL